MESHIEIYKSDSSQIDIIVQFERDTVWLSQKQMAQIFNKDSDTVGLHLKNIFLEEELDENATTENLSVVQIEGNRKVKRNIKLYNELGNKRIGDNALVAITIMIAESKSDEKDMMIKLVVNLINNKN